MKKKVLNVTPQGDFESQYGHFYKWEIEFDVADCHLSKGFLKKTDVISGLGSSDGDLK